MGNLSPATSEQIAIAANLNERYICEWLGVMIIGRFIEYNPVDKTYFLLRSIGFIFDFCTPISLAQAFSKSQASYGVAFTVG